jgi:hypothetical protein
MPVRFPNNTISIGSANNLLVRKSNTGWPDTYWGFSVEPDPAKGIFLHRTRYFRGGTISNGVAVGSTTGFRGSGMQFSSVTQLGSDWNNTTGIYTVSHAGYYLCIFSFQALGSAYGGPANGYPSIRKNGVTQVFTHWNTGNYYESGTISCIMPCNLNDTIDFYVEPSTGYISAVSGARCLVVGV